MNNAPVLQITGLSGGYSLNKPVLHDIALQVQPGEMVGLIGLNGAGKSTTMKHILGLMSPHKGDITVQGKTRAEDPVGYNNALSFVPESPLLYDEMTVREHVEFTARAYGVDQRIMNPVPRILPSCSIWRIRWTPCRPIYPKG